jgi:hypothetical protein
MCREYKNLIERFKVENVWKRIGKCFNKRFTSYKMAFKIISSLNYTNNLNPFLTD